MSYHYSLADFEVNVIEDLRNYSQYIFLTKFDALHQSFDVEEYSINSSDLTFNSFDSIFNQTSIYFNTSDIMAVSRDLTFNFCGQFTEKDNISAAR